MGSGRELKSSVCLLTPLSSSPFKCRFVGFMDFALLGRRMIIIKTVVRL